MRITFTWPADRERVIGLPKRLLSETMMQRFQRAVGLSAIAAQDHARENLDSMIYSQPPAASGYIRTHSLMRGVAAHKSSRPNTGQGASAQSGNDLKATDPMEVVERRGTSEFRSSVSNPVRYADAVEEGVRQPSPRPFMDGVEEAFEDRLADELLQAVLKTI